MAQHPLPTIASGTVTPESMAGNAATSQAQGALNSLNASIAARDEKRLSECFYDRQAWWKDSLALTYHLRTFVSPGVISRALLETTHLRGGGKFSIDGEATFIPATPVLVCLSSFALVGIKVD